MWIRVIVEFKYVGLFGGIGSNVLFLEDCCEVCIKLILFEYGKDGDVCIVVKVVCIINDEGMVKWSGIVV